MTALVTDSGIAACVNALISSPRYLGWGSGTGQGETDTDLASALPESRSAGTGASTTTAIAGDTYRLTGSILATGTRTVSEVGAFSGSSGANLLIYGDFNVLALNAGDTINFTIDVQFQRGA